MKSANTINIRNKKAWHDFEILEKFIAGMVLTGTEIKSIRLGKASLADAYCHFANSELYVKNMQITEYGWASFYNHVPNRDRKLLLTSREVSRLNRSVREKGLTIVVLRLFISDSGYAKLEIALAKGKKAFDKREDIKTRDTKRQLDRLMKRK